MVRVDAWEVLTAADSNASSCIGLPRTFFQNYIVGQRLGRGGNGVVHVVTDRYTGEQLACKSIVKRLAGPNVSAGKQAKHLERIQREIEVMMKLRGTTNVVQIRDAFEDDMNVYIVMEWCKGGELWHRIGRAHYSENTVASFMRAVLRTISHCHKNNILHRDVKPGNFMLLSDSPEAPLKAIDFGLAEFFDPEQLPRTDLGLEGTPWYMAPEVLECEVGPPSDVWSAGVMAYQLLSGFLPFDDRSNPKGPALSQIWQAVLGKEPKMTGSAWADISDEAKDFVKQLLNKDPKKRPTAQQALAHAWLEGTVADRVIGDPLDPTVVRRIQLFQRAKHAGRTPVHRGHAAGHGMGHGMGYFREALGRLGTAEKEGSGHGGGSALSMLGPHSPDFGGAPQQFSAGAEVEAGDEEGAGSGQLDQDRADSHWRMFLEAQEELRRSSGRSGGTHGRKELQRPLGRYRPRAKTLSRGRPTIRFSDLPPQQVSGYQEPPCRVHGGQAYLRAAAVTSMSAASHLPLPQYPASGTTSQPQLPADMLRPELLQLQPARLSHRVGLQQRPRRQLSVHQQLICQRGARLAVPVASVTRPRGSIGTCHRTQLRPHILAAPKLRAVCM